MSGMDSLQKLLLDAILDWLERSVILKSLNGYFIFVPLESMCFCLLYSQKLKSLTVPG